MAPGQRWPRPRVSEQGGREPGEPRCVACSGRSCPCPTRGSGTPGTAPTQTPQPHIPAPHLPPSTCCIRSPRCSGLQQCYVFDVLAQDFSFLVPRRPQPPLLLGQDAGLRVVRVRVGAGLQGPAGQWGVGGTCQGPGLPLQPPAAPQNSLHRPPGKVIAPPALEPTPPGSRQHQGLLPLPRCPVGGQGSGTCPLQPWAGAGRRGSGPWRGGRRGCS